MVVRNLPIAPTTFIGREHEIADITTLITTPACRLITLVGPGGIGKTRLAVEAASHIPHNTFANGIHFVDLTPVQIVDNIVPTIATAVGYQFPTSENVDGGGTVISNEDHLMDYCHQKNMLLLVDNAEHLPDSVFLIERILTEALDIKILVTSRVPLNSQWENLYEVQGLPVDAGAIDLFTDRAVRVQPRFDLQHEAACVTSICQLMEGMPLGLELAATWLRVLSCHELTEELSRNLRFLESRQRTVDQRHASLQAVFEQSWRLLTDTERDALMRLSVFKGTFTRDAAQQVARASLTVLTALVDQSLVHVTPEGRYRLHELVRQLSAEKLADNPNSERNTRNAHDDYFSRFIEQQLHRLKSEQMPEALQAIEADIDNVRAAWNHAIAVHDSVPIERMAESLHHYFVFRAYFNEGIDLYQAAIESFAGEDVAVVVQVYQSRFYKTLEQVEHALHLLENVYDEIVNLNDQVLLAIALLYRGHYLESLGKLEDGWHYLEQARTLYEKLGDDFELGNTNRFLAFIYKDNNDATTLDYFEENYRLAKQCGNQWQLAHISFRLGHRYGAIDRVELALEYYQQGLEYARQFGHLVFMSTCLRGMAGLQRNRFGDYAEANRLFQEALNLSRESGDKKEIAHCLGELGWSASKQRQHVLCQQYWEEHHKLATLLDDDRLLQSSYRQLAILEGLKGNFEERIRCSEQVINISRRLGEKASIATEYGNLAYGAFHAGRYAEGKRFGEQSLAVWEELPDISRPLLQASAHVNLAHNLLELGERRRALENFRIVCEMELQITGLTHEIMAGVAKAIAYAGDLDTAIKLLRFVIDADKLAEHITIAQRDYDDLIAKLPEDVVEELLAEADKLTHEEAVEIMLNHPIWREHRLDQPLVEPLSERELEVLGLVAKGKSNRQIAEELFLAVGTVKTHINHIMGKLDAQNRTEAVAKAQELGIL